MMGALISRDIRRGLTGAAWLPVAFFLLVAALVPFAIGPDARLLARIGAGALWIAALTAALLPIERLVEPDRADGVLDQLALRGIAEESIALAKIVAHWLTFGPLLLVATLPASACCWPWTDRSLARAELRLGDRNAGARSAGRGRGRLTAGLPRAGALAGSAPAPADRAPADLRASADALLLEAAVSLLLTAGAPFVAGAAIRAART